MQKREDLNLLVRQHPHYFVYFTEYEPDVVLKDIDTLVQQSFAQLVTDSATLYTLIPSFSIYKLGTTVMHSCDQY